MPPHAKRSILFFLAPVLALGATAAIATAGCGQCAADCISSVEAGGVIDIALADEPELAVELCHEGECATGKLTFNDSGTASCDSNNLSCSLEEKADGKVELILRLSLDHDEINAGDGVTVHVERVDTAAVLVDAKLQTATIEDVGICGTSCDASSVSWDE